ncbi:hypothetical protein [Kribbella sp. NPDC048915]|uniref:hypothetical protein n=1 Tax=Kribbella sp. NPDC048915 TaxID=3155148 RepID=UPI0033F40C21
MASLSRLLTVVYGGWALVMPTCWRTGRYMGRRYVGRGLAAAAIAVAACSGVGLMLRASDPSDVRVGDAFGASEGSYEIGVPTAQVGDDVWFFAPGITNRSSEKVTLEEVRPGTVPEGISFVEARLFEKDVFVTGIPLSWDSSGGLAADDPSRKPSTEVRGHALLPGATLPDEKIVYLHVRIATTARPLMVQGVEFVYEQGGRRYSQTLDANLVIPPKP